MTHRVPGRLDGGVRSAAPEEAAGAGARRLGLVDLASSSSSSSSSPNARPRASRASSPGRIGGVPPPSAPEPAAGRSTGTSVDPSSGVGRAPPDASAASRSSTGSSGFPVPTTVVAAACRGEGGERRTTIRGRLGLGADGLGHGGLRLAAHLDEGEVVRGHRRLGGRRRRNGRRRGAGECRERVDGVGGERAEPVGRGGRKVVGRTRGRGRGGRGRLLVGERRPQVVVDPGGSSGSGGPLVPAGRRGRRRDRMPRRSDRLDGRLRLATGDADSGATAGGDTRRGTGGADGSGVAAGVATGVNDCRATGGGVKPANGDGSGSGSGTESGCELGGAAARLGRLGRLDGRGVGGRGARARARGTRAPRDPGRRRGWRPPSRGRRIPR